MWSMQTYEFIELEGVNNILKNTVDYVHLYYNINYYNNNIIYYMMMSYIKGSRTAGNKVTTWQ